MLGGPSGRTLGMRLIPLGKRAAGLNPAACMAPDIMETTEKISTNERTNRIVPLEARGTAADVLGDEDRCAGVSDVSGTEF